MEFYEATFGMKLGKRVMLQSILMVFPDDFRPLSTRARTIEIGRSVTTRAIERQMGWRNVVDGAAGERRPQQQTHYLAQSSVIADRRMQRIGNRSTGARGGLCASQRQAFQSHA